MSKHTLVVVRHAKAQDTAPGNDASRELSEAGKEQARQLGAKLADVLANLDTVFVSPAVRAKQTWEQMAAGANLSEANIEVHSEPMIYSGTPTQIWDAIRFGSRGTCSLVVGHEPTISEVASLVLKPGQSTDLSKGMPTGAAVVLDWDRNWKEWHAHCATLEDTVHVSHK